MKNLLLAICLLTFTCGFAYAESPYIVVLGTAQDAGAPQIGCMTPFCKKAWRNAKLRKLVSSIALVDPASNQRWIFDATPDLPAQFQILKETTADYSNSLDGVFLTHAHIGHYTGLMYFGRESMGAKSVKVFAMPRMKQMLEKNTPWSQLVSLENILLQPLSDNQRIEIAKGLSVTPFLVPHRDEFSETVGYRIESSDKKFVYIPDIDKWEKWATRLEDVVLQNDFVFVDATFFADGEIPRPMSEVPHPYVSETISLLKHLSPSDRQKVHFIHFNHSNPLIQRDKKALKRIRKLGFRVAERGQKIAL